MLMKLFAPKYFSEFKCIADRCKHSCCVGWEINIDENTYGKYSSLLCGYGEKIRNSIVYNEATGTHIFALQSDGRCPHLNECGLCNIIIECGEECLSDICREHPRFYNLVSKGCEVGLGMVCEAAADIILGSDDFDNICEVGRRQTDGTECAEGEADETSRECKSKYKEEGARNGATEDVKEYIKENAKEDILKSDAYEGRVSLSGEIEDEDRFDALSMRRRVYRILREQGIGYASLKERLQEELSPVGICLSSEKIRRLLASFEYLNEEHRELFSCYDSTAVPALGTDKYFLRAFAYFVYRYASVSESPLEFNAAVSMSVVLTNLIISITKMKTNIDKNAIIKASRLVSEEIEYSENNISDLLFEMEFCEMGGAG